MRKEEAVALGHLVDSLQEALNWLENSKKENDRQKFENAKKEVNSCVRQYYTYLPMDIYNSHNQYLGYALYSGILGLSVLFIALFLALYKSYKEDKFLFVIMVLYCIIFLTENVLERQSGLILFCFLLNMIPVIEDYSQTFKKINQKTNT